MSNLPNYNVEHYFSLKLCPYERCYQIIVISVPYMISKKC